jgi:SGNH domain-containing protein
MSVLLFQSAATAGKSTPLIKIQTELSAGVRLGSLPNVLHPAASKWTDLWAVDFGAVTTGGGNSKCWDQSQSSTSLPTCEFGDRTATRTLVLTGDSQAWMWEPAFALWGQANKWKVLVLTKGSCQPWPDPKQQYFNGSKFPTCGIFQSKVANFINRTHPSVVVAAGAAPVIASPTVTRVASDVRAFVESIDSSKAQVLIVNPSPSFYSYDYANHSTLGAPTCLVNHPHQIKECDGIANGQLLDYFMNIVINKSPPPSAAHVLNLDQLLCNEKCPMIADGILIYIDNDHVSYDWAVHVAKALGEVLAPLVKGIN